MQLPEFSEKLHLSGKKDNKISQTIRSPPMKCDWLQIMTDNQINPYDWLDQMIILSEKVKVTP